MSHHDGVLSDIGHKAQELSDKGMEKMCEAGSAVKGAVQSGYDKVTGATKEACDNASKKAEEGKNAASEKAEDARDYMAKKVHEGADAIQGH
ncbi:unnamed protein product [Heligmosomoides polygyrus]|uniref:Protein LE25-like n=1 Tax=Heligmosomoides polygyrus TaxID=6339 RepID=A0A183FY53_HELPZ|nr:unnamed protein product [Heligmosomoides polygyrus]